MARDESLLSSFEHPDFTERLNSTRQAHRKSCTECLGSLELHVYIVFQYCLGTGSWKVLLKESCLERNEFCFQLKFMAVLSPCYLSFLNNPNTHSTQRAALPLCVSLPCGCKILPRFSSSGTGSNLFHFSSVVL